MTNFNPDRRRLLSGLGVGAGTLGAGALGLGFTQRVVAGNIGTAPTKLLVYLFLRGAMDGLSYMVPTSGPNLTNYQDSRDSIAIDPANTLSLADIPGGNGFGLNPLCPDLYGIRNNVAFIHACGHPLDALTRSHFDAQEEIELGTPGDQSATGGGFLARYLSAIPHSGDAVFTGLASSTNTPVSLTGYSDVATLDSAGGFSPNTGTYADTHLAGLGEMYRGGTGSLDLAAQSALDAVELINSFEISGYTPAGGVVYPDTSIGRDLSFIAQMWKLDLGIAVASLDKGGWDTHNNQQPLNTNTAFGQNIREVSEAVAAFYLDIASDANKSADDVCLVIQSEFGRQVSENGNRGTDHGYGNPMTVIGGRVAGGVYGSFPSIAVQDRQGDALVPTTDFRQVHASAMNVVLGADAGVIGSVFPGYNYSPINII